MSLDDETRALERRVLGGDAEALPALRRLYERNVVPVTVSVTAPDAPCDCKDRATEFSTWRVSSSGAGAWSLWALVDGRGCCSFLPDEREGRHYASEAEARDAAETLTIRRAREIETLEDREREPRMAP